MNTYPKAMHLPAPAVGFAVANDAAEEQALAALAYVVSFAAPLEAQPQPSAVATPAGNAPRGAAPSTVEEARAVLDGLGISYHHKAGLPKLLALIPSA
jgi:hypothetical protein